MVDHPNFMRLLNWDQAEGLHTLVRIASHFEPTGLGRFESLFSKALRAGLVRPDLDVVVMVVLVAQICWSALAALPLYQLVVGGRDLSSATVLAHLRKQTIALLVAGVTLDPSDQHQESG